MEYQVDIDFYQCRCHILISYHPFRVRFYVVALPGVTLRSPPAIITLPLTGFQNESLQDFITKERCDREMKRHLHRMRSASTVYRSYSTKQNNRQRIISFLGLSVFPLPVQPISSPLLFFLLYFFPILHQNE